jgi:hypothetical protein
MDYLSCYFLCIDQSLHAHTMRVPHTRSLADGSAKNVFAVRGSDRG